MLIHTDPDPGPGHTKSRWRVKKHTYDLRMYKSLFEKQETRFIC
jgi:hypothetical protein